jgi:hypothetical protein
MSLFAGLNSWSLFAAAAASFIFGGIYYGLLSRVWMQAAGLDEQRIRGGGPSPMPLVITFFAQLLMAWMLAGIVLHIVRSGVPAGVRAGLISGAFIWLGFVMTTLVVNHQFQMQKRLLTVIDGAHWLGVLLLQGAVIGHWGLK